MTELQFTEFPFFSVIVCTYNRAYVLERALNSLINQEFQNFEVLIINDGSTDNTHILVEKYFPKLRLRYFFHQNSGLSHSRNLGIRNSNSRYITFLDSDDEYKTNHLSSRYEILLNSNIDLLHGGFEIIGNEFVPDLNDTSKLISIHDCIVGGTFFFTKSIAECVGLFPNLSYGDDHIFFNNIHSLNSNINKTNIPTYIYYRDSTDSICSNITLAE